MFERTKSFWQRLLSSPEVNGNIALADGPDDRRVFVRFPADLETALKIPGGLDTSRLAVRVRNVSLGGVNLLSSRAFQPGDMITVELPGADDHTACQVLACVVHCVEEQPGEWSLGCTFSRELSDDDLSSFGARRERHDSADQRTWKRFPSKITATFQQVATNEQTPSPAKVLNISPTGVGLLVDRAI